MIVPNLNGRRMRVRSTGEGGVVSSQTTLVFEQEGRVVSGRYRGGSIIDGYLIGLGDEETLTFCFVQADIHGHLDAGSSRASFEILADGRILMTEQFEWTTRPGKGINVFEEIP
jgi:hypothetical protein